jgi:serine/threonine protein kinase/Flp pilus assembly protein TadD
MRLTQDEHDRIGERLGTYEIVRELGRGGMGAVYLANRADGQFKKRVAIKVIKRGTDTDEVLRRFRIERQILANLEHPNITHLLDAGTTGDGLPYFVMEFIEGTPITRFVRQEDIDFEGRLKLFLKVCSAVDLAHRNHVIHRDIKPSNVLVNRDGEPKLLDFGIAKLLSVDSDDGDITVAAERRFTTGYAAPEQSAGETATITTDVYALGALLYELLTNKPPRARSSGNPSHGDRSRYSTDPQLPSQVVPDHEKKQQLEGQLDRIVARATRCNQAQRYSSVIDLSEDIERYLSEKSLRAERFSAALPAAENRSGNLNAGASSRRLWYVAAVLGVVGLAAVFLAHGPSASWLKKYRTGSAIPVNSPSRRPETVHSIAVLPFKPLGSEISKQLLGLGMADAVIGRMSKLKQLVVLPTSSVSDYAERAFDPIEAGRSLGVEAVLSGTVQRSDDRLRVTVQLVHVADGRTVWSEKFDQTFTDIFSIQDSISESVVRSLALNLTTEEQKQLAKRYTTSTAAYDSYLMGLYFWTKRSKEGLAKAINYFQQAVEEDSNFSLAYALIADCYYLQVYYRYDATPETIGNAKAAAERALLLDDSVAEGYVAIAMVHSLQKNGALCMESLRRALELNPNLATAHLRYAWCLCACGQLDDAVREMKRAQELDPLSPTNDTALGMILAFARQFRGSLEYCYKAAELAPDHALIQENLAMAYSLNGMYQQAIEHYERVGELNPENKGDAVAWVATVLVTAGRKSEADSMMPKVLELATAGKADPYNIALLYAARGEKEPAFKWFAKALETDPMMDRLIRYDPQLDALRSDSRFAAVLRQHNRGSLLNTP